jgi:L,D-transpeptidase catalytic domain
LGGITLAATSHVRRRFAAIVFLTLGVLAWRLDARLIAQPVAQYRLEMRSGDSQPLRDRFTDDQLALLEKLNRADRANLDRLPLLVMPASWNVDEQAWSRFPARYPSAAAVPKLLVVFVPGQMFGAYEAGSLVRWGPVSSGGAASPTPVGTFTLNWRSAGRASTLDPNWFMYWYFNFGNREGLAFHEYALPGNPASHGCIRLLQRDAQWLYEWGDEWSLTADGRLAERGTPVSIIGEYDFGAPPPWQSSNWLDRTIDLPEWPAAEPAPARRW